MFDQVPLGLLPCNEMINNEMVEIMSHLNQYVPLKTVDSQVDIPSTNESVALTKVHMEKLLFGGDQLTVARARGAKKTRMNSTSAEKRFDGLIPCAEDWHTKVVLLEVIYRNHVSSLFKYF